jgi:hypothetical protein
VLAGVEVVPQAVQRPIAVLPCQALGVRPVHVVRPPVCVTCPLGGRTGAPIRRQREQGRVVGGWAAVLRPLRAQEGAEAPLFPPGMGRLEHAIPIDVRAVVDAHIGWDLAGRQLEALIVGHTQETLGEAAQGLRIDLVRPAERLDDAGFRASPRLVVVSFGERVVDGVGTALASLSRRSQVQAYASQSTSPGGPSGFHASCIDVFRTFSAARPCQHSGCALRGCLCTANSGSTKWRGSSSLQACLWG